MEEGQDKFYIRLRLLQAQRGGLQVIVWKFWRELGQIPFGTPWQSKAVSRDSFASRRGEAEAELESFVLFWKRHFYFFKFQSWFGQI